MQSTFYKGYLLWGHAIPEENRYTASGTITQESKVIEASGILAHFMTEGEAETAGLQWAKAWVDSHS
jgi:hypothetical protein